MDKILTKYGEIKILDNSKKYKNGKVEYLTYICKCYCGNNFEARKSKLLSGKIISCGCSRGKSIKGDNNPNYRHGFAIGKKDRILNIYRGMKSRCENINEPAYKYYGARGINCNWDTFKDFYEDMKEGYTDNLEIDRIDNNGNYCKENCKWSTRKEQMNNTRYNNNIEINGITKTKKQWSEFLGINYSTLSSGILNHGKQYLLNKIQNG